jgi:hypothetical protein
MLGFDKCFNCSVGTFISQILQHGILCDLDFGAAPQPYGIASTMILLCDDSAVVISFFCSPSRRVFVGHEQL